MDTGLLALKASRDHRGHRNTAKKPVSSSWLSHPKLYLHGGVRKGQRR
jgi:hypothetical protein